MLLSGFPEFQILNTYLSSLFSLTWPIFHLPMNWKKQWLVFLKNHCIIIFVILVHMGIYLTLFCPTQLHLNAIHVTYFQAFNFKISHLKSYKYCRTSTTFDTEITHEHSVKIVSYWLSRKIKSKCTYRITFWSLQEVHWNFGIQLQLQRGSWYTERFYILLFKIKERSV